MNTSTKTESAVANPKRAERGSAMVETALVLLTALAMILFIMDMGRVLLTEQFIAERARTAVRSAVVNSWDSTAVANYVVYGTTSGQQGSPAGLMGLTPSQVTYTTVADTGVGDGRYQVTVQGIPLFTWVPYIAGQYTTGPITATAPIQSQGASN